MFPTVIQNDADLSDLTGVTNWLSQEQASLKEQLATSGAVLFRGFPIDSAEAFDRFTAAFGYRDFTYEDSLSNAVRINLTPRVFTANEAPPDVEIFLHHEMAQTPVYPHKLFFFCRQAAETGGATPVCRSDELYADFKSAHPKWAEKFESEGLKYRTHMPADDDAMSGQGRSWRSTLSVDTQAEAEARLQSLGYTWTWQADGSLATQTPRLPAVRELADGNLSFFNQVIAALRGWKRSDANDKPVVTFGDDTPISEDILSALNDCAEAHTIPLAWQDGDIALVDNFRVMHGRYPYGGERRREVLVCLAMDAA